MIRRQRTALQSLLKTKPKGEGDNPSPFYMKKFYPYLALIIIAVLALIPPIDWFIKNPYNDKWLWMITISGFLGFLTCFVKTNWYVRRIALVGFLNCFFSVIPYLSFTAYVILIGCCWFYICCERIEDWEPVFKAMQAVLLFNVFLLVMECFNKDPLLNFYSQHSIDQYAVMGHRMLMGSFAVVISGFLLSYSRFNIAFPFLISLVCLSQWSFFCATVGLFLMMWPKTRSNLACSAFIILGLIFALWASHESKFYANLKVGSGRGEVWAKTFDLTTGRPWLGWGIGSYKDIFPALNVQPEHYMSYRTAHNFILELAFEVGWPLTLMVVGGLAVFLIKLWGHKLYLNVAGISMVITDAMVHFPDRVTQCVPIIIALIAYSSFCLQRRIYGPKF